MGPLEILGIFAGGLMFGLVALTQPVRTLMLCVSVSFLIWIITLKTLKYLGPVVLKFDLIEGIGISGDDALPSFYSGTTQLGAALVLAAIVWGAGTVWSKLR